MSVLILFISLAIGVSFLCSVLEAVLLSVTPAYVEALHKQRPRAAVRWKELKADIDRPLAAILSLNTIAHTIGAAGAGAQATRVFGSASVGLFSAALTLAILILSEIIPKTLGAVYWRRLAPNAATVLKILILLLLPLVWLSRWITRMVAPERKAAAISREELAAMAEIGARQGAVEDLQARILRNLFRFDELVAQDVMTPRTVVVALPEDSTMQDVAARDFRFSRLPVYRTNIDNVRGYILKDDAVARVADGDGHAVVRQALREVLTVATNLPLPELFDRLLERHEHIAVVVDPYGGLAGIVTMEDVIETLLGLEIVDEVDVAHDTRRRAREQWQVRARRLGLVPVDENGATEGGAFERVVKRGAETGKAGGRPSELGSS